eukprot:gb/GECH01013110.1/.p1 GENE.gb/GECH01013110.1/~~gb/GECH01013110.1/.p1  ORF type:complete len:103 (+),score=16.69 gb/GECH01013110.1/:1-309(+)
MRLSFADQLGIGQRSSFYKSNVRSQKTKRAINTHFTTSYAERFQKPFHLEHLMSQQRGLWADNLSRHSSSHRTASFNYHNKNYTSNTRYWKENHSSKSDDHF